MSKAQSIEILARGVFIKNGQLLLCHTKGARNTYLPGGHVEFREKAAAALQREIREELGRSARVGRLLGVVEHTFIQKKTRHCELNMVFEMKLAGLNPHEPVKSKEDYIEFFWISLKKLRQSELEPAVLRKALSGWLRNKSSFTPHAST